MKLSLKSIRFVIDALEHYQEDHRKRLCAQDLSEDEISDLTNDEQYLEAIKKDLEKYRDELTRSRDVLNA